MMKFHNYNSGIMSDSTARTLGILAVVIIAAAAIFLIEVQPRVGAPEALNREIPESQVLEDGLEVITAEQVGIPNVKIAIVMSEWGFKVDGQAETISPEGTMKGGLPITVKVGEVVEITLTNEGKIVHDFNIALRQGEHHHDAMEHQAESLVLNPGETEIVTFVAETAGTYTYHCGIPGHSELGMLSSFVIIAEDGGQEHLEHDVDEHHEEEHHGDE